jgi:pimeloyl-ACP methyl ester carboxylesterase
MKKLAIIACCVITVLQVAAQQDYPVKYMDFISQQQQLHMAYIHEQPAAGANGITVLLLHGKNFYNAYWKNTIAYLLGKGYSVLAPDQIGFGNSSMPAQYQFSLQQLALNTQTLLDTLGIKKMVVLGHSMGGMLAVRYALMYPQYCRQLVLEDPIGLEDWKLSVPYLSIDEQFKKESSQTRAGLKQYMTANYFHGEWKAGYDSLLAISSKNLGDSNFAWCMALTSDMIFTQPVCYEFKNIKVPAVLITGRLDKTAPGKERAAKEIAARLGNYEKLSKEVAAIIPGCRLVLLDGIGHIPHAENFDLFKNALDKVLVNK